MKTFHLAVEAHGRALYTGIVAALTAYVLLLACVLGDPRTSDLQQIVTYADGGGLGVTLNQKQAVSCAACFTFAVAQVMSGISLVWAQPGVKQQVAAVVCYINSIAGMTHLTFTLKGDLNILNVSGDPMSAARFLEWGFSTPGLILLLSCLSPTEDTTGLVRKALFVDVLMISCGFVESYVEGMGGGVPQWAVLTVALGLFILTMKYTTQLFDIADSALALDEDRGILRKLYIMTIVLWTCFPLVRFCEMFGVLSLENTTLFFTFLDVVVKMVYSITVMVVNFKLMDQIFEARITGYENYLKIAETVEKDKNALASSMDREAEEWRKQREAEMLGNGMPASRVKSFLDSALKEYMAFSTGNINAFLEPRHH